MERAPPFKSRSDNAYRIPPTLTHGQEKTEKKTITHQPSFVSHFLFHKIQSLWFLLSIGSIA